MEGGGALSASILDSGRRQVMEAFLGLLRESGDIPPSRFGSKPAKEKKKKQAAAADLPENKY